jgi:hypothetical protein
MTDSGKFGQLKDTFFGGSYKRTYTYIDSALSNPGVDIKLIILGAFISYVHMYV